jgi:hypothetical protein
MSLNVFKKRRKIPEIAIDSITAFEHYADTSLTMNVLKTRHSVMVMRNCNGVTTTFNFSEKEARALIALLGKALAD